jgi:GTP-binding protein Era
MEDVEKDCTLARQEIEGLLGTKIFLQIWVKVNPIGGNSSAVLRMLGYESG